MVDDHNLVRRGLVSVLNGLEGYQVTMEAAHGKEFLFALEAGEEVDIAIVDLNMPVLDGYTTIRRTTQRFPEVKCIALTFDDSEEASIRAMRAGARGFILKTVESADFKQALDHVRDTGYYASEQILRPMWDKDPMLSNYDRDERARVHDSITEREREFIELICSSDEFTYEEIAERMNLQLSTVETHRRRIFERFGVKSKSGLVVFAFRWGIVSVLP